MKQKIIACLQSLCMTLLAVSSHVPVSAEPIAEPMFILNVNGYLDGASSETLEGYATVDVYINGSLVADNVTDYCQAWPSGTEYRIMDITTGFFKSFNGYHAGKCQGTISSDCLLELDFTTVDVSVKGEGEKLETFNGHTYLMFNREETWYSAHEICNALGGHLVSINSKEENDYIANFTEFDIWTGGTDRDIEGKWIWTSGEPFIDFGFAEGEPNNVDNNEELEENYLEMHFGVWNDSHGNFKKPFICEFDRITNPYDFYGYLTNAMSWTNIEARDGILQLSREKETFLPRQIFHFAMQEDGYFTITDCYDDKALTANPAKKTVSLEEDKGKDSQAWWIDLFPYASPHPRGSDLVLQVSKDSPGEPVVLAKADDSDKQGFTAYDVTIAGKTYSKPSKPTAPVLQAKQAYQEEENIVLSWSASKPAKELDQRTYAIRIHDAKNKTDLFFEGLQDTSLDIGKLLPETYEAIVFASNDLYEGWRTESNTVTFTVESKQEERNLVFVDDYWYENNQRQGAYGDPKNITDTIFGFERGREIYDPASDGWYWLDAVYGGKRAKNKEVWMPYIYQNEDNVSNDVKWTVAHESDPDMGDYVYQCMIDKSGKWVRYDENGKMFKGWLTISGNLAKLYPSQAGNTYYYDNRTGLMAKGTMRINGKTYTFDKITGALQD